MYHFPIFNIFIWIYFVVIPKYLVVESIIIFIKIVKLYGVIFLFSSFSNPSQARGSPQTRIHPSQHPTSVPPNYPNHPAPQKGHHLPPYSHHVPNAPNPIGPPPQTARNMYPGPTLPPPPPLTSNNALPNQIGSPAVNTQPGQQTPLPSSVHPRSESGVNYNPASEYSNPFLGGCTGDIAPHNFFQVSPPPPKRLFDLVIADSHGLM